MASRLRQPLAARVLGHLAAALAISFLTAACSPPPPAKKPESAEDRAEKTKIDKAKKLMEKANEAYDDKDYDGARKFLQEAEDLGVESLSFQISEQREKVDKKHAKLWANEVDPELKEGDCAGAFKELAEPMRDLASEVFTKEVRRLLGDKALACVQAKVDEATTGGKFAAARALVGSPDTKTVLGAAAQKKLVVEVETTIAEALRAQLDEPLKAKRWADALAKVDDAQKKGDASEETVASLLAAVRDAMKPEVTGLAVRGVGAADAPKTLEEVDRLIKLARWEPLTGEAAAVAKDKAVPEEVGKKRQALAVWVEALRLKFKPDKKPTKRWSYGKAAVLPAQKSDAPSKRDLAPATEVWVLGLAGKLALVTDADVSGQPLAAQLEKTLGWVPLDRLATANTIDWIPPDDQLVGARVWAPLRAPEPNLELGVVSALKGQDVTVKRIADDKEVVVKKATLRTGRLAPGTKVVAFCQAKTQVVTIEEVLPDQRTVRLVCDGGLRKDEVLPSLRARPEDMPAPKK
jgi:hypothetical protein